MIKLTDIFILENSTSKYKFGCVMLNFDFPELLSIQERIDPNDIYNIEDENGQTYGLEDEPHCTLLYGLHNNVSVKDVKNIINNITYSTCKVHNISIFKNEKYDVLKFEVKGEGLHETNKLLKEFPHTSNFPKYEPHLTIGYLNSGKGEKYVKLFKNEYYWLIPTEVIYSYPDKDGENQKEQIKINID